MNYLHDNRLYACSFMSDLYSCKIQVIRRWNNSLSITFLILNSLILYNHFIHFISQKHVMKLERIREIQFKIAEEYHMKLAQDFDKKIIEFYNKRKRYFKYVPINLYLKFYAIEIHRPMLPEIIRTESWIQMRTTQEICIRKKKLKEIINWFILFN